MCCPFHGHAHSDCSPPRIFTPYDIPQFFILFLPMMHFLCSPCVLLIYSCSICCDRMTKRSDPWWNPFCFHTGPHSKSFQLVHSIVPSCPCILILYLTDFSLISIFCILNYSTVVLVLSNDVPSWHPQITYADNDNQGGGARKHKHVSKSEFYCYCLHPWPPAVEP